MKNLLFFAFFSALVLARPASATSESSRSFRRFEKQIFTVFPYEDGIEARLIESFLKPIRARVDEKVDAWNKEIRRADYNDAKRLIVNRDRLVVEYAAERERLIRLYRDVAPLSFEEARQSVQKKADALVLLLKELETAKTEQEKRPQLEEVNTAETDPYRKAGAQAIAWPAQRTLQDIQTEIAALSLEIVMQMSRLKRSGHFDAEDKDFDTALLGGSLTGMGTILAVVGALIDPHPSVIVALAALGAGGSVIATLEQRHRIWNFFRDLRARIHAYRLNSMVRRQLAEFAGSKALTEIGQLRLKASPCALLLQSNDQKLLP